MMNYLRICFTKPICRNITTSSYLNEPRSLTKLKKIQADFQCEDGRPIYLKNGKFKYSYKNKDIFK